MPQYNRAELGRMATESGFVRDTFEKMLRLKEILKFLNEDKSLREHLLLKGGNESVQAEQAAFENNGIRRQGKEYVKPFERMLDELDN